MVIVNQDFIDEEKQTKGLHCTPHDRDLIELGLKDRQNFTQIGLSIGKHPTTVSKEVRKNRTALYGHTWRRAPYCMNYDTCQHQDLCHMSSCYRKTCRGCRYCHISCSNFVPKLCTKLDKPPYVCNGCPDRGHCRMLQMHYVGKDAQAQYKETLAESRTGTSYSQEELLAMTKILTPLVKGQSLHHIVMSNRDRLFCSERQLYRLIEQQLIGIKAIDLPRKVRFRPRKKKKTFKVDTACRVNRSFEDYLCYIAEHSGSNIVQMDTVLGTRDELACLLTIYLPQLGFLLIYPREQNTAASVEGWFLHLRKCLGEELFYSIFAVLLTDNGAEFSNPQAIEFALDDERLTRIFYCDPGQSQQKGAIEHVHTLLRRIIPKGTSVKDLSESDCLLIASHINSYHRKQFGEFTAFDLFAKKYGLKALDQLGIVRIAAQEVNLSPSLLYNQLTGNKDN